MPRLSLWNPKKGNDYRFFDRTIREQFQIGGTGAIVHKFLGPDETSSISDDPLQPNYNATDTVNETTIQDLLFLENRDRKYEKDLYELKGVYTVSGNDFDLSQFGLFLTNDILYMTFHMNHMTEILGRRLMNGDVIELPHLSDDFGLDADTPPIPKFYVVQDGSRSDEGFSPTWYPHIWRVKLGPITDSQEFADILGDTKDVDSMKNIFSTFQDELDITDAIVDSAEQNDPIGGSGGSLTSHLYNFEDVPDFSYDYGGTIATGSAFPVSPNQGDVFVRTDFKPNRLFRREDLKWVRLYDNIDGKTWSDRTFNASTFINNDKATMIVDGIETAEKQNITDVILPKPDFNSIVTPGDIKDGV